MKLFISILLTIVNAAAIAQEMPTTQSDVSYYSSAQAERSRRKEHPWKWKCIGHDTEWVSDANVKASFTSKDKKVTQKELVVDGVHDDIRRHVYETLSYDSEYSANDKLSLHFSSSGNRTQQNEWEADCTATKTQSSVTSAHQELSAKAYLIIPKNVYALRITNTQAALKNVTGAVSAQLTYYPGFSKRLTEQSSVRQIVNAAQGLPMTVGDVVYQLVRPGDALMVDLELKSDELTEQAVDMSWDINMLGNKDCQTVLAAPNKEFAANQVLSLLQKPIDSEKAFDDFVTRTSCLRNADYIHELMVNSSGKSFAGLIEGYDSWLDAFGVNTQSVARTSNQKFVAQSVAELALFDLSENLLQDMTAYCRVDTLPVLIGLPPAFKAMIRGYHSAARKYLKVDYLFQIGRNQHIDLFLEKMKAHETAHLTYAQADSDPEFLTYAKAAQYKLFTDDIRVYDSMKVLVQDIPTTVTGSRSRAELDDLIAQAGLLAQDVSNGLRDAVAAYGRRHTDVVQAAQLRNKWASLLKIREKIAASIRDDLDWYKAENNDPLKSRFTHDLSVINRDIYQATADILTDTTGDDDSRIRREIFLKSGDTDTNGRVDVSKVQSLSMQINQCLSSPTNGANQ